MKFTRIYFILFHDQNIALRALNKTYASAIHLILEEISRIEIYGNYNNICDTLLRLEINTC